MPPFALRFWSAESKPLGRAEILDHLRHRSHFKEPELVDGLTRVDYVNPNTRTCFELTMDPQPEREVEPGVPPGFCWTGLSFQMDLPSTSWTAREAASELASLVKSLRLILQDVDASRGMQDAEGTPAPPFLTADGNLPEELLRRWRRSCMHEIAYLAMAGTTVPYVPEELVRRWWEYSSVEHLLKGQVGSGVRVNPMFIAEHPETKEPVTGTVWSQGSAIVVPRCDVLLMLHPPRGLLSRLLRKTEASLLPYPEVVAGLAGFLQPFEGPPPLSGLRILAPERLEKAGTAIAALRGRPVNWKALRYLHEEPFSDLRLAE